ncbi:MAG: ABC transporter permease subunit [Myxococcota bacterium]|nr:ABC transporter permease subunit [Myxococcota bacterium]
MGGSLIRALRRREQPIVLAIAGATIVVLAILPIALVLVGVDLGGLSALANGRMWTLLGRTLALACAVVLVALAIGVPLGVLLGRTDVPLRRVLWLVHAFPMFLPPFLPALGWFHLLGSQGLIGSDGTARVLFGDVGFVLVLGVTFAPIVTSLTALGVSGIDASLEESARTVARPWRVATRILVPAAAPAIALSAIVVFALALSEIGVAMFLRVDVYSAAVFARLGGVDFAPGEALALALPLVPITLALLAAERRFAARRSFAVLGLREARDPLPLRRWRVPVTLACITATVISIAPLVALAVRYGGAPGVAEWASDAPWNGLLAGAVAATIITMLGLVVGHAAARRLPGATVLDSACMLTFVMPAAILGVGVMKLWNRPDTQLVYGTIAIIVIGLVARYVVVGVRVVACAVAQSSVHLEEAAAASGARFGRRLVRIVIPVNARGVAFAWLLALVFCLRDIETVILFYPPGSEPLTVRIFTLEANGPPAVVAGLCVLHVAITAAVIALGALLVRRRR